MDAKSEILQAIGKTDDGNMKMVLLLLLTILEEIGGKIDAMRSDEQGLREAVLNGHEAVHPAHHEWIAKKIQEEEEEEKGERDSRRKIRDGLIEKILWLVLVAAAGASGWVLK